MKLTRICLLAALAMAILATAARTVPDNARREKSRYYFLQGAVKQSEDKEDAAYELYRRAYEIDPDNANAALALGTSRLMLDNDSLQSSAQLLRSLDMIRQYADEYPGDYFESGYYAYMAGQLGRQAETTRVYERIDSLFPSKTSNLLRLADAYMMVNRLEDALGALDRYEQAEGMSPQLTMTRVSYLLAKNDTARALEAVGKLLLEKPRDPNANILTGNVMEFLQQKDSAIAYYERAEKFAPENVMAKLALAQYYKMKGDSVAYDNKVYEALLSEDLDLEDKSGMLAEYLQILLNDKSDTSRGDYLFSVLRDQYPHEPVVLDLAARYSAAKHDFKAAEEYISYALDQKPDDLTYWAQLMTYQFSDDRSKDVIETYKKASEHVATNETMRLMYANACMVSGDQQSSIAVYRELIDSINPELPIDAVISDRAALNRLSYEQLVELSQYYCMLGDTYYSMHDTQPAFAAYENAIMLLDDNALALNNYAYFLAEEGLESDKALDMSSRAVAMDPENPTFLDTYAWVLFKRGDYPEALVQQCKAVALSEADDDTSAELYSHYGDILFMNGDPKGALEQWKKALELEPDNELLQRKVTHKTFFYE